MRFTELFEGAYEDGFSDGLRGRENPRASAIHGPNFNDYARGYRAGLEKGKEKEQEAKKAAAAEREKLASMSDKEVQAEKERLETMRDNLSDELAQARQQARAGGLSARREFPKKEVEITKKYGLNLNQIATELRKIYAELDRRGMNESATAGATSAGNVAAVANPTVANAKIKRDKNGVPIAPQAKNKDGTAKNALNLKKNLFSGEAVKR